MLLAETSTARHRSTCHEVSTVLVQPAAECDRDNWRFTSRAGGVTKCRASKALSPGHIPLDRDGGHTAFGAV